MSDELIEKQVIFEGRRVRVEVHHYRDELGQRRVREVCVHPGAVVILPLVDDETVMLIRQRRPAVEQLLIELPAGTIEKNEPPINAAGRELLEETGHLARKLTPLCSFFSSPGILTEMMHVFVARELQKRVQALDPGEEIELRPTPMKDAIDMIFRGEIRDAKTIAALLFYDRFRSGGRASASESPDEAPIRI